MFSMFLEHKTCLRHVLYNYFKQSSPTTVFNISHQLRRRQLRDRQNMLKTCCGFWVVLSEFDEMLEFHTCNKTCFQHAPRFHQTFLKQVVNHFQEYPECFPVWGLVTYKPWGRSRSASAAAGSSWPWDVIRIPYSRWCLG
jgi:hypothetical protein